MSLLTSLKHRAFALLWIGQTTSRLGDSVYGITLDWWILQKTHSATAVGVILIVALVPRLALLLVGGVVADRAPRLWTMLTSDLIRAFLTLLMTVLAVMNLLPLWLVIGISFCFGLTGAFFIPAYRSVLPQLLPKPFWPSANALRVLSGRIMSILGPTIGAGLIAIGGTSLAFAINCGSFLVSASCITMILSRVSLPALTAPGPKPQRQTALAQFNQDVREGLATVIALPWIWISIVLASLANVFAEGAEDVVLPYFVQQTLHATPLLFGAITSCTSVGTILGVVWSGGRRWHHRGWLIHGFFVLAALMFTLIGLIPWPPLMLVAMLLYGLFAAILGLAWTNALQEYVPPDRLGRVVSLDELGSYLFNPLSYGFAGGFVDRFGASTVLIWGGLCSAAIIASALLSRSVRQLD